MLADHPAVLKGVGGAAQVDGDSAIRMGPGWTEGALAGEEEVAGPADPRLIRQPISIADVVEDLAGSWQTALASDGT